VAELADAPDLGSAATTFEIMDVIDVIAV